MNLTVKELNTICSMVWENGYRAGAADLDYVSPNPYGDTTVAEGLAAMSKAAAQTQAQPEAPVLCICQIKGVADLCCPVHGVKGTKPFGDGQL